MVHVKLKRDVLFSYDLLLCLYISVINDILFCRLVSLSLVLLVVPFLPATNLLFRVGFVIAERVLYLSVAGAVLLSTLGINALVARLNKNVSFSRAVSPLTL